MFDAWTLKNLQDLRVFLTHTQRHGITTINEAIETLDTWVAGAADEKEKEIARQTEKNLEQGRARAAAMAKSADFPMCPSCGKAPLLPVKMMEGLERVGCHRCKYTQVVHTKVEP